MVKTREVQLDHFNFEDIKFLKRVRGNINDYYQFGNDMGTGQASIVKQGIHIETGFECAIKIVSKEFLAQNPLYQVQL